jgi:hypothetical protein
MVTERFTDEQAFRARTIALEQQLDAEHWKQVGSPEILPPGWRGPMHSAAHTGSALIQLAADLLLPWQREDPYETRQWAS